MRILHVVTYVSEDGAFGGPIAVAKEQARTLASRGHQVTLAGGWDGAATLRVPGVTIRLFRAGSVLPGGGFRSLTSPGLMRFVLSHAADFDIVHVHLARDAVTLAAASLASWKGTRLVLQTHGMVIQDPRPTVRVTDRVVVSRVMRRACTVLALNTDEARQLSALFPAARVHVLGNGVPRTSDRADGRGDPPDVLFASRLHPRKKPEQFLRMALLLRKRGLPARFSVVGPDGGSLDSVMSQIASQRMGGYVTYEGPLQPQVMRERMSKADVFVLPSVNEPFPMALLEAMSVGLPSVITNTTGVSALLREHGGALVTDGSAEELAAAVEGILGSHAAWQAQSTAALTAVHRHFDIDAVVDRLVDLYARAVDERNVRR